MIDVYEYRQAERRPVVWAASLIVGFSLGLMIWQAVPFYAWLIWAPVASALLARAVNNPAVGVRLTQDDLTLSPWQVPSVIPLSDVRFVRIVDWRTSTDMEVHLKDNRAVRIQDCDMPPRHEFIDALQRRNVAVETI